ncbi:hypothetical protein [Microvirga rosea]|uniref:hypothetical protein n=1 Tax=Microvirga rosea TaxID=2715425 RepID=UPI001D0A68D8|nr:hypothetical protein [Microvirga rosea]MCB8819537.1 hypothetical protein [Microvirga rosea]
MQGRDHPNSSSIARRALQRKSPIGAAPLLAAGMMGMYALVSPDPLKADNPPSQPPPLVRPQAGLNAAQDSQTLVTGQNIATLLPLIVTLPEHKRMAAHLEALIRQNDFDVAEQQLQTAIEMGTFATILIDWLRHPDFLPALQTLDLERAIDPQPSPQDQGRQATDGPSSSAALQVAALQEVLKQERERAEGSARDLVAVTNQLNALENLHEREAISAASDMAAVQEALAQQKARADAAEKELAHVTDNLHALQEERSRMPPSTASSADVKETPDRKKRPAVDGAPSRLSMGVEGPRALRALDDSGSPPLIVQLEKTGMSWFQPTKLEDPFSQSITMPAATFPLGEKAATPLPAPSDQHSLAPQPAAQILPATPEADKNPTPPVSPEERLTLRGDALFRQGDVSGARLLLERAREAGSARATFILAETYDPQVLSERGVVGIRSDAARARDLYNRALAQGIQQASVRLDALK